MDVPRRPLIFERIPIDSPLVFGQVGLSTVAVRQESAAGTGRIKRPRLQIVVSEPTVEKVEALAKERGMSVSATCAWILERHFEQKEAMATGQAPISDATPQQVFRAVQGNDDSYQKFVKVLQLAKEAGVL